MTKAHIGPKPRRPKNIPEEREITLPPRDYQPTKAEKEREGIRHARR